MTIIFSPGCSSKETGCDIDISHALNAKVVSYHAPVLTVEFTDNSKAVFKEYEVNLENAEVYIDEDALFLKDYPIWIIPEKIDWNEKNVEAGKIGGFCN